MLIHLNNDNKHEKKKHGKKLVTTYYFNIYL